MPKMHNPLFFKYLLICSFPGCQGKQEVEQAETAGWTLGQTLPEDPSCPDVGRCPMCKRHQMKVTRVPDRAKVKGPKGWDKIPTK